MNLAGELIRVESDLEEQIATLGEPLAEDEEPGFIDLPQHEIRRIRSHLLDETVFSLHQVQESVHRHFNNESNADFTTPMEQIAGALELIGESETASLAIQLRHALANLLHEVHSEVAVDPDNLEALTDAVAAFELYLAGCRDQQRNRERFLEILKDRLERLPVEEGVDVYTRQPQPAPSAAEETPEEDDRARMLPPEIDPELLDVFLEEYEDVFETLQQQLPNWLSRLDDVQSLTEVRRCFHTLKGKIGRAHV